MLFFLVKQAVQNKPPGAESEGFLEMRLGAVRAPNHDNPDPNPTTTHNAI